MRHRNFRALIRNLRKAAEIKRGDWVTAGESSVVGVVRRVARDGSWADVGCGDLDNYHRCSECSRIREILRNIRDHPDVPETSDVRRVE